MSDAQIDDILRRVFEVIVREARHNPALAQKLVQAITDGVAATAPAAPQAVRRKRFDASHLHAINILRRDGESALRGRLEQVRAAEDLRSVARASGLVLSGNAGKARASRSQLIAGIVEAAKHYDAQRGAATA
jgi:hypothetical protein